MSVAEVRLWGRRVGAVSWVADRDLAAFEYEPDFRQAPVDVAPLMMPKERGQVWMFPQLPRGTFHGLPGMLADVLPDKFGSSLLDQWLTREGRDSRRVNPVERLCFLGSRGMGALEFRPAHETFLSSDRALDVSELVDLANRAVNQRGLLKADLSTEHVAHIIQVGTSAGGARAKAVVAWNPETNAVRSGQVSDLADGFEHWLIKFDGVSNNKDKEDADPQGYGLIEYAYHLMAMDAGITMSPCRLFVDGPRSHFMTKRFDRVGSRGRLHMQSLCALTHADFNHAGGTSYEQALATARQLGVGRDDLRELYRRMVFNVFMYNRDDHTKNIAFLMDQKGRWSLSPAFDMCFAYNPDGAWTGTHQMSVNGKREDITREDLQQVGRLFRIHDTAGVIDAVMDVRSQWPAYAERAGVFPEQATAIGQVILQSTIGM